MSNTIFNEEELMVATNNFARQAGSGGSAQVFLGVLGNGHGRRVAVKKYAYHRGEELQHEVSILSRVVHENVLQVLGSAPGLLVTPYLKNGNLDDVLHHCAGGAGLDAAWRVAFVTVGRCRLTPR